MNFRILSVFFLLVIPPLSDVKAAKATISKSLPCISCKKNTHLKKEADTKSQAYHSLDDQWCRASGNWGKDYFTVSFPQAYDEIYDGGYCAIFCKDKNNIEYCLIVTGREEIKTEEFINNVPSAHLLEVLDTNFYWKDEFPAWYVLQYNDKHKQYEKMTYILTEHALYMLITAFDSKCHNKGPDEEHSFFVDSFHIFQK